MARRVQNDSIDGRDWTVRAREQLAIAEGLPHGPEREAAIAKAEQFRKAAEMMEFLRAPDSKSSA